MNDAPLILEKVTRLAPLGLRFRDVATDQPIGGGLSVVAYPQKSPWKRVPGVPNPSGVYVFHHLPSLEMVEWGAGDDAFWASLPAPSPFTVEVQDPKNHFLPCTLEVLAPHRQVYTWQGPPGSFPEPAGMVPLFSSPARPVPAGMAVIRADLQDAVDDTPARGALLEAYLVEGGYLGRGMADERGRVALYFPYPGLPDSNGSTGGVSGSISNPTTVPFTEQTWQIELCAYYQWSVSLPAAPDLYQLLSQAPARLWASRSPEQPLAPQTLQFGQELIVKSEPNSFVFISQP